MQLPFLQRQSNSIDMVVTKGLIYFQAIKSPQLQYSHFVSIPLALHSKLLESVVGFQKDVLESVASSSDGKVNNPHVTKAIFYLRHGVALQFSLQYHGIISWLN